MKNIHIIPTDKPSRLRYFCGKLERMYAIPKKSNIEYQNIYITSDEEIKEGDWFISLYSNSIQKELKLDWTLNKDAYKKIILTTDQDLIGVQAIDDKFLEWFVKNPSCEEVEVERMFNVVQFTSREFIYKMIIPKEESFKHKVESLSTEEVLANRSDAYEFIDFDKQETLEEAAAKYANKELSQELTSKVGNFYGFSSSFIEGAKWQQEKSYSEEEVKNIVDETIEKFYKHFYTLTKAEMKEQWFEQFKKK